MILEFDRDLDRTEVEVKTSFRFVVVVLSELKF